MLYYLFDYLAETGIPGSRLMNYITFRSGAAFVLALFIAMVFGRRIIDRLQLMKDRCRKKALPPWEASS